MGGGVTTWWRPSQYNRQQSTWKSLYSRNEGFLNFVKMGKTLKHIPREHLDQVEWNLEANNGGTSVTVNDFPGGGSGDLNSKIVNGFIGSHQVHESNLQTAMKLLLRDQLNTWRILRLLTDSCRRGACRSRAGRRQATELEFRGKFRTSPSRSIALAHLFQD